MIVLDTHIWIWWVDENSRLSSDYEDAIRQNQDDGLGISIISYWEIALLHSRGRIKFNVSVNEWIETALALPHMQLLPITPAIAIDSVTLPGDFHKDPADRIIVATAREHDCPVVTYDSEILNYPHVKLLP